MWRYWQAMEQWRRSLPVTLLTFSDLQLWALDLLEYRPEIAKKWQAKWAHVMIDEAQDTSDIQWSLINHLSRPESLFIVGDENQSIYGFRAAVPQNFLEFANRPGCKVYSLSTNYRSHDRIVEAANKLIASTRSPLKKEMRPHKEGGAALDYFKASDAQQEAFEVITRIKKLKESDPDLKWGQIAVISRTNAPLESYERLFDECGIPFTRLGAHSNFYSRASVQEVIKTLTRYQEKLLPPTLQEKFLRVNQSPASLINAVISGPGKLKEKWSEKSEDDIPEEDWAQLVQVALGFDTLEAFLEKVKYWQTLRSSEEKDMHHVSITTAHQAKGLEWDHVFCVAMCDLQIPHPRAQDKEEEKRILYVMITRAAKALCLSNPSNLFGKKTKPSPLILPLYS
jgi:DNA helicase-2/ATP-dependent DNA helicase PcrA